MTPQQQQAIRNLRSEVILYEYDMTSSEDLRNFWTSIHQSLADLQSGNHNPDDLLAFTIHQCCDGFYYQQEFLDAFARDIVSAAVQIQSITGTILSMLHDPYAEEE